MIPWIVSLTLLCLTVCKPASSDIGPQDGAQFRRPAGNLIQQSLQTPPYAQLASGAHQRTLLIEKQCDNRSTRRVCEEREQYTLALALATNPGAPT